MGMNFVFSTFCFTILLKYKCDFRKKKWFQFLQRMFEMIVTFHIFLYYFLFHIFLFSVFPYVCSFYTFLHLSTFCLSKRLFIRYFLLSSCFTSLHASVHTKLSFIYMFSISPCVCLSYTFFHLHMSLFFNGLGLLFIWLIKLRHFQPKIFFHLTLSFLFLPLSVCLFHV
jgi:hypothetical protein